MSRFSVSDIVATRDVITVQEYEVDKYVLFIVNKF